MSVEESAKLEAAHEAKRKADGKKEKEQARERLTELEALHRGNTLRVTEQLEQLTGMESRLTILGHLQRGGTPSAADRLLATTLGVRCAELIGEKRFGVMVAARNGSTAAVPLEDVAGNRKSVPLDHPWLMTARRLGVCLGD